MPFVEKPPILTGRQEDDMAAMHDYLFRMAQSINEIVPANSVEQTAVKTSRDRAGRNVHTPVSGGGGDADLETVRKNARELRALILKSAQNLQNEIDNIQFSTFYIKYADDFAGAYPETMYNTPTANTYYMGVCSSTSPTAPTDPSVYSWSRVKGNGGTGLNSATVFLYRRSNNPPPKPRTALTYTFASGRLDLGPASVTGHKLVDVDATVTGHKATLNTAEVEGHIASATGWTQEIPDSDGRPCWVITATAIATTATDEIAAMEWSDVKKLVEDGKRGNDGLNGQDGADGSPGRDGQPGQDGAPGRDGQDGADGYNTAIVYLYTRAATAPSKPQETLTYSFPDKAITGTPQLPWHKAPQGGTDPLYVTAATARSRTDTDTIGSGEWSDPVILAENGEDGQNGQNGAPGLNSATTFLYQRADNQPSKPQAALTYTFSTHTLDLTPISGSGWAQEIPAYDGKPCWITTATAASTTATDSIDTGEWSEVVKLAENGQDGQDGAPGANGTNGTNGYNTAIVYLYMRSGSTPPAISYDGNIKYTFSSGALSSIPTGWSRTIPAVDPQHTDYKLYVTAASARSRSTSAKIAANAWAAPVLLAENGQQGVPGQDGEDGKTTYLHIKYSDDGEHFTGNDGEDLGAWIGTYTDYTEDDSLVFSAYRWHRFSDDTELKELITTSQNYVINYVDQKEETYNGLYLAKSEFGTFEESLTATIQESARGVVESYNYGSSIRSVQDSLALVQDYFEKIDGEIRRGIVYDPSTESYVLGIAISQNMQFSGECGKDDPNNPDDGYTYYYIESGQTFGLYTSDGWQFWINGTKRGWFNSTDGMLHVRNILAEDTLQVGPDWQFRAIHDSRELEILYVGE